MDQGVAAILAAGVAGAAGALGAVAGARAAGRAARGQAAHEQALRARSAAIEAIDTACNAFHQKGYVAIQAVVEFEAAVIGGHDGTSQEREFSVSISAALMATHEVRWCSAELEEPARQWCDAIQKIGQAIRALRATPDATTDPASPSHHRRHAAWLHEKEVLHAFQRRVQQVKESTSASFLT
ncbi:hypothetical protein AB0399_35215 [Streptomyces sp. NPDC088194]|uniref:hypothetical protein n=1 Tax=Streptomyces sp. NPDC088194 TaxID=3154931 RepID=UPI00344DCC83